MNSHALKAITGLSDRQTKVYLALLRGGQLTQTDIARAISVNRTSLYQDIKELLLKELIVKTVRGKRIYYVAQNPKKLLTAAKRTCSELEDVLPELIKIHNQVSRLPVLTVHEGSQGIYQSLRSLFEEGNFVKSFAAPQNFLQVLETKHAYELMRIVERRDIQSYVLTNHTESDAKLGKKFSSRNVVWRKLPSGIEYPVEFACNQKTVIITSWHRQFSVVIESKDIADFISQLFDYFWKIGK